MKSLNPSKQAARTAALAPIGYRKDGRPIFPILGADDRQTTGHPIIDRLEQERADQFRFIDKVTADVEAAGRDLSDTERANIEAAQERVGKLDEQLKPLREFYSLERADQDSRSQFSGTRSTSGEEGGKRGAGLGLQISENQHKYRSIGEFLADAWKAANPADKVTRSNRDASADRLRSHGLVVGNAGMLVRADVPHQTTEEVPGLLPESIIGPVVSDVDAARPFISSVGAKDLSSIPGTTFERPTVTQHVAVGQQAAEKDELPMRQFKVGGVPFTKDTYGGWANVSRQGIDWTSPAMWDALMLDFIEQYGLETEEAAAADFVASIVATEPIVPPSEATSPAELRAVLRAIYAAAVKAYKGSGRLPNRIWASLDWWVTLGVIMDHLKATTAGDGGGSSTEQSFAGNLLRTPRVIVPSFPEGTLILGVAERTEVYEDRIGFLSAIQPKVFGIELAYGGYMASGTVKPSAFAKVTGNVDVAEVP